MPDNEDDFVPNYAPPARVVQCKVERSYGDHYPTSVKDSGYITVELQSLDFPDDVRGTTIAVSVNLPIRNQPVDDLQLNALRVAQRTLAATIRHLEETRGEPGEPLKPWTTPEWAAKRG